MNVFLRHNSIKHNLSLFLVGIFALHFLVLHGGLSGFVLCIGNDGHVAVERSTDDVSCSDKEIPAHPEVTYEHTDTCCSLTTDHCGDCRDIALTSDCQDEQARAPQKASEIKSIQPLAISGPLSDPGGMERRHQKPVIDYLTSHYLSLASIRSTVLLI